VQQRLDALVRDDGFPAALASVTGRDGRVRNYTAGVGDLRTRAGVPVDGQVRIAVTELPSDQARFDHLNAHLDTALCQ
jgi:hypothetical protein